MKLPFFVTLTCLVPCIAFAQAAPPAAATPTEAPPPFAWKIGGNYSIWGLDQHNFYLGDTKKPLNDADYVVQNFRLNAAAGTSKVGGVLRMDAAQGWWGVDNSPDRATVYTQDANGKLTGTSTYNPNVLFENKDTMYGLHVDHAYLWTQIPGWDVRVQVGRQGFQLGNMLVLDQDLDAVRVGWKLGGVTVGGFWAKIAEGVGSYKNPKGALMNDDNANADADLAGLTLNWQGGDHKFEAFALRYLDRGGAEAYFPQGIGYFHARFQPQVSEAMALGLRAAGKVAVAKGLHYDAEVDVLAGRDDIANTNFGPDNLLDKNDGTLLGWNAWLQLKQAFDAGKPMDVSLSLGMGSGDADPSGGKGNLNRIQTMGFFPLLNVWEDSIMPDIAGITPQGLGSPASRGYRELENTTVALLRVGVEPYKALRAEVAYAFLRATEPVHGWDASGPTAVTSSALGQEVDLNLQWKLWDGLSVRGEWGWFQPGEAAGLVINGNTASLLPAWESKVIAQYAF